MQSKDTANDVLATDIPHSNKFLLNYNVCGLSQIKDCSSLQRFKGKIIFSRCDRYQRRI